MIACFIANRCFCAPYVGCIQGLNVVVNQPFGGAGAGAGAGSVGPGGVGLPGDLGPGGVGGRGAADSANRRPPSTGNANTMAASVVAAAAAAAAASPPMTNEGRWTDNGQPLTVAEGRTVIPMLEQVERAVTARLMPSNLVSSASQGGVMTEGDRSRGSGSGATGSGEGGAAVGGNSRESEELKEEQVQASKYLAFYSSLEEAEDKKWNGSRGGIRT